MVLWRSRNGEHISIAECEAYARVYFIHDVETFVGLMLACDYAVHDVSEEIAELKAKRERLKAKTKGNGKK